jgi:hypothetical protein
MLPPTHHPLAPGNDDSTSKLPHLAAHQPTKPAKAKTQPCRTFHPTVADRLARTTPPPLVTPIATLSGMCHACPPLVTPIATLSGMCHACPRAILEDLFLSNFYNTIRSSFVNCHENVTIRFTTSYCSHSSSPFSGSVAEGRDWNPNP